MRLSAGDKLGPYEVVELIGQGGMGEVYRATDTRLGRPVAIKVSAREFNERFEREASAISALNHPNICTLYDIGPNYLVMEYVEGEPLSKIIARGPLPLDKALSHAIQIVDALAAAHAKGIIHRDLKPGNIIITKNGVKVLDFGLAKLGSERVAGASAENIDTVTEPITRAGAVLGTLYYMAPEQVEAKECDERSDIFSFGAVFYEMITGQRPFTGDTQAAVLASLMKDSPPPIHHRQPAVPKALERVVRKCLEKKPEDRWHSARDLKPTLELIDLDAPPMSSASGSVPTTPVRAALARKWLWPTIAVAGLIVVAALAYALWPKAQPPARVTRFEVALPPEVQINPTGFYVRISPDGSKLAFTSAGGKRGIWIRDLESIESRLLPGTEQCFAPFWSPDSKSLAFGAGNRLMRVEVSGGPPQVLAQSATGIVGSGFWTKDGQIVFGSVPGPLQKVSASGGVPTPVTALAEGETVHTLPSLLPDGRHFLYLRQGSKRGIFAGSLDVKPEQQSRQQVAPGEFGATYAQAANAAGGVVFFVREGTLMAQPFDAKALRLTGDPVPVVEQIGTGVSHAHFSVTSSGVMAYRTGAGSNSLLTWIGRATADQQKIGNAGRFLSISLSPDESQVALFRSDTNNSTAGDIWLLDLARNVETRLTTGQSVVVPAAAGPIWSPDNHQLAYVSGTRLYTKDVGGATEAKLVKDAGGAAVITDWTRDGRFLIYAAVSSGRSGTATDLFALDLRGGNPMQIASGSTFGKVSPDGHWIAFQSQRSGPQEVYVRPFTAPGSGAAPAGPVIQISAQGGLYPKWRADGKELFFMSPDGVIWAAEIDSSNGAFHPTTPASLGIRLQSAAYSPNKTAQRFLLTTPLDQGAQTPITVVTNWEATLQRK